MNSSKHKLIIIGSSTGGPGLLEKIITSFTDSINGSIIIAQHMDTKLLDSFTKRLNRINKTNQAIFVQENQEIQKSKIYVLEKSTILQESATTLTLVLNKQRYKSAHRNLFFGF